MKKVYCAFWMLLLLIVHGCKKESNSTSSATFTTASTSATSTTTSTSPVNCDTSVVPDGLKNGCSPRLVTPTMCETIDLRNGKTYEFAWTTDGSTCETPWTFQIAGNPLSTVNIKTWTLPADVNQGISRYGGVVYISAASLDGLTTDNGIYHWTVTSFYDSYPASRTFKVLR